MSTLKIREDSTSPWQSIPTGGVGVPAGGTTDQFLTKASNTDFATQWSDLGVSLEWEYEGDHGSQIISGTWTATYTGVAVAIANWSASGGGSATYWYIKDNTTNETICTMSYYNNGQSTSTMFPIVKGHTYSTVDYGSLYGATLLCYKLKAVVEI